MRHPLHPVLVHFPVACWSLAVVADFSSLYFGKATWQFTDGLLAVGCVMAVVAMMTGLVEIVRVPEQGKAMRDAIIHVSAMSAALLLFGSRLLQGPYGLQPIEPTALSFILDAGGFTVLVVGGWFGGRLVYGHGVGSN